MTIGSGPGALQTTGCPHRPSRLRPEALAKGRVARVPPVLSPGLIAPVVLKQKQKEKTNGTFRKEDHEREEGTGLIAYHVLDREKAPWTRIGAAWDHKDGEGFTLQIDLVPVSSGRIILRAFDPKAEEE
jgi:hypothetical protein